MRILRIVLLILGASASAFAQTPPAAPQGTGRISGVITRLDTGRPVPNTTIRWVRWEGGRGTQGAVRTDAQGRFSMEKLVAGSYEITASADGLVTLQYGQRATKEQPKRIELMDGQQFSEADIVLPKTSAIEGQLLDEFGDPVPGVSVQIAQVQMAAGKTRLMPMGTAQQPAPSDDLGHFRAFNLPPGDYYVLALSGPFAGPETAAGFAVTYYPGTSQPTNAKAVHLETGQDATGVTFALEPAKVATVSGVAVDATGKPVQGMLILVQTAGDDVRAMVTARGVAGPDGAFTFRNVAHGTYALQAFGQPVGGGNLGKAPFGALPFTLGGDRDDLRIVIRDGAVARGRIIIEGDASALKPELVRVIPGAVEFVTSPVAGGPPNTVTNPDWTFEVQNQSGLRAMRVSVGAQGWGVKQIMLHGKDVTDTPVDFRSGDVN
ncbi:MAG: carboxypeptidase regulatory-like domain-containing protein, partial [Acidobacteria bacterium]|nr:carboxypeptidase regulatory-like domain-containing protein [Acidobacteriota bacterium]